MLRSGCVNQLSIALNNFYLMWERLTFFISYATIQGEDGDHISAGGGRDILIGDKGLVHFQTLPEPTLLLDWVMTRESDIGGPDQIYAGEYCLLFLLCMAHVQLHCLVPYSLHPFSMFLISIR